MYDRHCAKLFTHIVFKSYKNLVKQVVLSSFFRWEKHGSKYKKLAQVHIAGMWQSWELTAGLFGS